MYHISRHYLGQKVEFTPRIPISQNACEIDLPARVCAAPSIEQCWEAINGCNDIITELQNYKVTGYYFFVYQFPDTSSFAPSTCVKDFEHSNEMISLTPVKAELISVFYVGYGWLRASLDKAKQHATTDEAISAYNDWQGEIIKSVEAKVYGEFWADQKAK